MDGGMFRNLGRDLAIAAAAIGGIAFGGGYVVSKLTEDPMQVETVTLTTPDGKALTLDQEAAIDFLEAAKKTGQDYKITGSTLKIDGQKVSVPIGNAPGN